MGNISVFLACDNPYVPYLATAIASICFNSKSFIDFYVLNNGINSKNIRKIELLKKGFSNFSIEFIKIDTDKYFKNLPETKYISKAMYFRFLIPILKPEINKAIYSDCDIIALGDISKMFNENLASYPIGAVEQELFKNTINYNSIKQKLNLSFSHDLFFSGNLLINCKMWRELDITNKLLSLAKNFNLKSETPDQDILNKFFDNNYKKLDKKYCFTNQAFDFYKDSKDIIIRHFNGEIKPWHLNENLKTSLYHNHGDFWKIARRTAFYEELKAKTLDENEQKAYIRKLQYWKLKTKIR